ncbi:MAG TPA: NAD-dependent epimerase/dehydratase family protein [Longimicrobiaceae bacterium]|nr:NAD-dependent epimerase/dehydratase family protein [Longimicrobiaceae bacterium]
MRRRALITGATGFVGNHLVEHLASLGWELRALVRPTSRTEQVERLGIDRVVGDLADPNALARAVEGMEIVYHLAAVTGLRGERDFERANVEGTQNLAAAIRDSGNRPRRVVYLSSYAACGPMIDDRARTLDDPQEPLTAYGRTKLAGEETVRSLASAGVDSVIIRAPAVYGPGDHAFFPYFRLVDNRLAPAPTGSGRRIQLLYVVDLVEALTRAADAPSGTFPVAGPVEYSWSEITSVIARALGRRPLRIPLPAPLVRASAALAEGFGRVTGRATILNREKAEEMLAEGWLCDLEASAALLPAEVATDLEDGIANTVHWYRGQGWL